MKKLLAVLICLAMLFAVAPTVLVAEASGESAYILHDGVKMYSDNTLGTVIAELSVNTPVTVTGSEQIGGETYYILNYNGSVGYVRAAYVYYAEFYGAELNVRAAKCLAEKVGGRINVYASPAEGAEVIYTLSDGVRIDVAECGSDEYYLLIRGDGNGYVKKSEVTEGLSRNQRVALAVTLISAVCVIGIFALIYVQRNKEYIAARKARRNALKKGTDLPE